MCNTAIKNNNFYFATTKKSSLALDIALTVVPSQLRLLLKFFELTSTIIGKFVVMIPLPKDFIERIENGPLSQTPLLQALDSESPISIRLNDRKSTGQWEHEERVSWCNNGRYLSERPSFTLDPLFHAGTYYPQEAGSMYIDAIVRSLSLPEDPILLDLCAAPGGKSTLLASYLNNRGMLISNEIIRSRSYILAETLTKWGFSNTFVSNNAPADFEKLPSYFDFILVDAPCSGEGMFRKDPNARLEWSLESAAHCAVRQADILDSVWPSLKEDGYLLLSLIHI